MLTYNPSVSFNAMARNDLSFVDEPQYHARSIHHDEMDAMEPSKQRACLKKTTKFLFSHIGLVGLVVVYAVAGGFLFQLLEIRQEKINCQEKIAEQQREITQLKQRIVYYVENNATPTDNRPIQQADNTTVAFEKIHRMLLDYRNVVIRISAKYRMYSDDCSVVNKWTFPNSLLFAITIITTIGYGNTT